MQVFAALFAVALLAYYTNEGKPVPKLPTPPADFDSCFFLHDSASCRHLHKRF